MLSNMLQQCALSLPHSICCHTASARAICSHGDGRSTQWEPTREGYLKFLAESKALFQTLENIVEEAPHPDCGHLTLSRIA